MKKKRGVKQKSLPEDFRVEELAEPLPEGGAFALYRLSKRGLGTPEVIDALLRRWKIPHRQVSFGGLKDRHAITAQWVTIRNGPRRNLKQTNFELAYQGQVARPFEPKDIRANAFQITLRNLSEDDAARAQAAIPVVQRNGLPNYFDQQRFGSLGQTGDFIGRAWCAGDYERVIWLVLADPNPHDRPEQRAQRQVLREHWGDWAYCQSVLPRSTWRNLVSYLAERPQDFRGAIAQVNPDQRSLFLAAFQSFLWNRVLGELLRERLRPEQLMDMRLGDLPGLFYRELDAEQREALGNIELPLPSARMREEMGPWKEILDRVLEPLGLRLEQLRVKYPRDSFFSKGTRSALYFPAGLEHRFEEDDLHPGQKKLTLEFELGRGSYATILTRRVLAAS